MLFCAPLKYIYADTVVVVLPRTTGAYKSAFQNINNIIIKNSKNTGVDIYEILGAPDLSLMINYEFRNNVTWFSRRAIDEENH